MVPMQGRYLGNKKIEISHGPSGAKIITAAPKDNNGDGSSFSPTDLVGAALGACMLTVMGIVAERSQIDLSGSTFSVEKHMNDTPRRIGKLPLTLHLPKGIAADMRTKLERSAHTCPVHHSLHPDIEVQVQFLYDV